MVQRQALRAPADVRSLGGGTAPGATRVGAKFEELLVVTEDDAYWLDDDLPHVRRWQARGLLPQAREAA